MSADTRETSAFEALFRSEYAGLLRYASILLKQHGSRCASSSGRAEDVVQEMFYLAWEKRADLLSMDSPAGWLYSALEKKVRESIRDEKKWIKRLTLIPECTGRPGPSQHLPEEWYELLPPEDLLLLRQFYLDGYSYRDLCRMYSLKKSTLAMRI